MRRLPVVVAARSRRTIRADDLDQVTDVFAVEVESDLEIGVDRTMKWGDGIGSHAETAAAAVSRRWLFAEGATGGPFNLFYLLAEPRRHRRHRHRPLPAPRPEAALCPVLHGSAAQSTHHLGATRELSASDVSAE